MGKKVLLLLMSLLLFLSGCGGQDDQIATQTDSIWMTEGSIPVTEAALQTETVMEEKDMTITEYTENTVLPERLDADFVRVRDYIPDLIVEMKYAYPDNFTGHSIYDFTEAYLRYGTVKKLMAVQEELRSQGLGLKLWDGFRPTAAQFKLWEILPDSTYVANPNKGFSSHSRGNTVDITVVNAFGEEIEMPTGFDDFSAKADRDYSDCTEAAAANAMLLQNTMEKHGFVGYYGEWWHFADSVRYDVEVCFDPSLLSDWYADCQEYISLRREPDTAAEVITRIPVGETFTLMGYAGDFAYVEFLGQRGYVLTGYIAAVE